MSSLSPSSTDFQLIASVNLTTSIYIISSFTLNRLIKSGIEDRHSRCYFPSITRFLFCLFYSRPKLKDNMIIERRAPWCSGQDSDENNSQIIPNEALAAVLSLSLLQN